MNSLKVCYSRIWHAVQMETFPLSLHHLLTSTPSPTASRPTASCPKKGTEKPGQVMEEGLEKNVTSAPWEDLKHMGNHVNVWKHRQIWNTWRAFKTESQGLGWTLVLLEAHQGLM